MAEAAGGAGVAVTGAPDFLTKVLGEFVRNAAPVLIEICLDTKAML